MTSSATRFVTAAVAAVAALVLALVADAPAWSLVAAPLAAAAAVVLLWNTHWALCFTAFAIAPLNVVQYEIAGVTLNLPEVVILALAAKEMIRLLLRKEPFAAYFPRTVIALYLLAAVAAIPTGMAHGNGVIRVLQDFRQFNEFILLFWLVLQRVTGRRQVTQIAACYVVGIVAVAVHGLMQQFAPPGVPKPIADALMLYGQHRIGSFYGATTLGGLIVLGFGPALGLMMASRRRTWQVLLMIGLALCLGAAAYTGTRASFAAIAFALVIVGGTVRPPAKTVAAVLLGVVIFGAALGAVSLDRLARLRDPLTDRSLMLRAAYYTAATHIFRAHPVLGLGWGAYYDVDAIVASREYVETPRPEGAPDATAHSAYLQLLVKTGTLGVLGLLAVLLVWLERCWRAARTRDRDQRYFALLVGLAAGVAGYLFHSTFENFFQWPVMAQSFWLLLGLSLAAACEMGHAKRSLRVPVMMLGVALAVLAVFFYASLRLAAMSPYHYRENVAAAVAAGDIDRALRIAGDAARVNPLDPMAHTVYGRLLMTRGRVEEGVESLLRAVQLGVMEPGAPPHIPDLRAAYYFAPARLSLGAYYLEQGRTTDAVEQFELARAHADLSGSEYEGFHADLYAAYAQSGLWARALEFGAPSDADIEGMSGTHLAYLAEVIEGRNDWQLAENVARQLLDREDLLPAAHYLLGRAALVRQDIETAADQLRQAAEAGHAHANFFLGSTLLLANQPEDAFDAFLRVPADNPYRPFALAQAATLATSESVPSRAQLYEETRQIVGALAPLESAAASSSRYTPVAMRSIGELPPSGAAFPVLVRWEDTRTTPAESSGSFTFTLGPEGTLLLRWDSQVLQLQWVENLVNWAGVAQLPPGRQAIPGWIDTAQEWFGLRAEPAAQVQKDASGRAILAFDEPTWFYSVPHTITRGDWLALAAQAKDAQVGLQAMDAEERVQFEFALRDAECSVAPWAADWHALRVTLTVPPHPGDAAVGNVALIALTSPPE